MATNQQATGPTNVSLYEYDIFLSFRGPDIRASFTDVLHEHLSWAGLRVFRDDDELKLGDMINKILPAIDNSRLCIPIFSKTFAQSKWCLWEVTRMVELQKQILPIFYDVTVDDVNLETPMYNKFMPEHVTKSGEGEVEKWKEALKTTSSLDGKQVLNTGYTAFCESFVKELLIKLKPRRKIEIDTLIGLEDQLQRSMQLLDIHSTDVRYIGIYGMGGIGKTTLAKDIFNKIADQFDGCSFLEGIRESFRRGGTTYLLEKLLNSLNIPATGGEPENLPRLMEECFRRKKILIVLDDVNQWEQVRKLAGKSSWFGSGSRIIVTSRDKSVMERGDGKLSDGEIREFEMEPLGNEHALQLFNRHAFKEGIPSAGFEELSGKAVSLMGGLPLALKIIGSSLYKRKREVWVEVIEKLKEIPESEVKERLRISYDSLQHEQQQIFLDIACFFVGSSRAKPIYMWKASKFCPNSGLEILCSMSLVKVSDDGKISMHDQLRDLGRDIVREENIKLPAYRSRLWEDEAARKVLMTTKDKQNVEALCIEGDFAVDLTQQVEIGSLENLRYLDLPRANLRGDFEDVFPNLRWLSYHENLQATNFAMRNLVILDFSCTNIDESWVGWSQLKDAKNLKVLDLSEAEHLTRTPYFPEGLTLERLILDGCSKLVAIDGSIGHLKCLKFLSLERCNSLTGLPDEVGYLEHLEYIVGGQNLYSSLAKFENLDLSPIKDTSEEVDQVKNLRSALLNGYQISSLPTLFGNLVKLKMLSLATLPITELPESFGELKSLVVFDLDSTEISNLPDSIEGFVKLETLSLRKCKKLKKLPPTLGALKSLVTLDLADAAVVELPPSVGTIISLVELDLSSTGILELPESIGGLENLKELSLFGCSNIKALPDTIGDLKQLVSLYLSRTGLTELPESIGGLENLREITLKHCPLKTLPKSFGALKKLEKLDAQFADLSGVLPSEISGLSSLKFLNLSHSRVSELPSSISKLHRLKDLHLLECNQLRELSDLPTNLMELLVSSTSLHSVHQLSKLQNLRRLTLLSLTASSDSLFGICELSQLVYLKLSAPANTVLLPDEFGNLTRLKTLLLGCLCLRSVPRLPLSIENMGLSCVSEDLHLQNLSDLKNLSSLEVRYVSDIGPLRLSLPESLRELYVSDCSDLESWPDISHLKNIRNLHMSDCQSLTEIPGLGKLKCLEYLVLERCHSLTKLENLSELKQIECVRIDSCRQLGRIEGVDCSKVIILGGEFQELSEMITNERYDICSLLSSPGRDFLIRGDGHHVKVDYLKGKKVCLYFHRCWVTFAYLLISAYIEWQPRGDFVVVRVPDDSVDEEMFDKCFFWMDWLAVPLSDSDKCRRLLTLFKRSVPEVFPGHQNEAPQLTIFDESGQVLTTEGFELIGSYGPVAYPFTPERIQHLKNMDDDNRQNQSITSIFPVPLTEFVLTLDGNELPVSELEGKIVGIYFSSSSYEECTGFTSLLHDVYKELKANVKNFEIVWAPIEYYTSPYKECSVSRWLFVCFRLYFYFSVSALPTLVIIGEDGKTVQTNAVEAIQDLAAKAYPFTPEKIEKARKEERVRLVVSICREFLIANRGDDVDASTLADKNILLYFSAHRSSRCCAFLPKLMEEYEEIQARDDALEVIFISNDEDEASFDECFSAMPWCALPFGDERISLLYSELEVVKIPTLVAIGPANRIITKDVRDLIIAYGSDAYPFTDEHISSMVESWPYKLQHALHAHELALTERYYNCDGCNYPLGMPLLSYYCKECDFDLHPKCAFKGGEQDPKKNLELGEHLQ